MSNGVDPSSTWGASEEDKRAFLEAHGEELREAAEEHRAAREREEARSSVPGAPVPGSSAYDADKSESESDSLEDKTKEELYELATEKDITGRSHMTKEELIEALEEEGE